MGELVSPNQMGNKGNAGGDMAPAAGGKLVSPDKFDKRAEAMGVAADQASGGKLISPSGASNSKEASGHGDGRGSKGNDAPKNRAWMS